jgi:hypothetical protein
MWIYTKYGFISVVQYASVSTDNLMLVRARKEKHLEALFPDRNDIFYTPNNDYPFRLYMYRKDFVDFLVDLANDVDYCNFKAALPTETYGEQVYSDTCLSVWAATAANLGAPMYVRTGAFAGPTKKRVVKALSLPKD